jgi:hypothetical protein
MTTGYDIQRENRQYLKDTSTEFMQACRSFKGPEILDPRTWYKIEMQASMGSCVGQALTGVYEAGYRSKTGKIAQFSRMFAYLVSQQYSDIIQPGYRYYGRDGGALIGGARKAALEAGVCFESTFKYPNQYITKFPPGSKEEAAEFTMGSSSTINNYDEAKAYLESGLGGIIIGAPWPFNLSSGHVLNSFRSYGSQGHAWTILGYLKDLLVAANSHDVTYADKGFFYLTRQGFNEMVANRNTSAVGLSDLKVPRGRKVEWSKESLLS